MNERDKETIKLGATIMGNIAAISVGVSLFEKDASAMSVAIAFALIAFYSIRRLQ